MHINDVPGGPIGSSRRWDSPKEQAAYARQRDWDRLREIAGPDGRGINSSLFSIALATMTKKAHWQDPPPPVGDEPVQ